MDPSLKAALVVTRILDDLGVAYYLCGSLASSQYGMPRATLDADMVADIKTEHVAPLVAALGDEWYADDVAMRQAVNDLASFNLIQMTSGQKVVIFVFKRRRWDYQQMADARRQSVAPEGADHAPFFASPEHTVLAKLEWYVLGECQSERQWQDIKGVLQVQGARLDVEAMKSQAQEIGLAELMDKLLAETPIPPSE